MTIQCDSKSCFTPLRGNSSVENITCQLTCSAKASGPLIKHNSRVWTLQKKVNKNVSFTNKLCGYAGCFWAHGAAPYMNLALFFLVDVWAFRRCPFHIQSCYYHLSPVNLFTCGMFQTGAFGAFHDIHGLLSLPSCQLWSKDFAGIKLTYLQKKKSMRSMRWNIIYAVFVLFSSEFIQKKKKVRLSYSVLFVIHIILTFKESAVCIYIYIYI